MIGRRGFLRGFLAAPIAVAAAPILSKLFTKTATAETFDPFTISMVRRVHPSIIASQICGVQPMKGPTGLIFSMRSKDHA